MRWSGIHIEGFGKWSDYRLQLGEGPTVIYGPNEAGKSTILGFARSMLYGFASKANRTERQEPLYGGKHGGRLYFQDALGLNYVMERYASSSGKVIVKRLDESGGLSADGDAMVLSQPQWERQFLDGISERIYRELFAITLTELQAIGMLEGDELGKQLYHAGWSGGAAAAFAEKQLTGQLDALYRPKGSTQPLNRAAKTWEELENELRRFADPIETYRRLTHQIEEESFALRQEEEAVTGLRAESALLDRAVAQHELWLNKRALLLELASLATWPLLPEDLRHRHDALMNQRAKLLTEIARLDADREECRTKLSLLPNDEAVLDDAEPIEHLLLSAREIASIRTEIAELAVEIREHRAALARLVGRISPDWTEESLSSFHATVEDRDTLRRWRGREAELQREMEAAETLLRSLLPDIRESRQLLEKWQLEMESLRHRRVGIELKPQSAETLQSASRLFEEAIREWELAEFRGGQAAESVPNRKPNQPSAARFFWAAAVVLGLASALLVSRGWPAAAAAAGAGAIAGMLGALFWPKQATDLHARPTVGAGASEQQAAANRLTAAVSALIAEPGPIIAALRLDSHAQVSSRTTGSRSGRSRAIAVDAISRGEAEAAVSLESRSDIRESIRNAIEQRLEQLREAGRLREKTQEAETRLSRLHAQEQEARQRTAEAVRELNDLTSRREQWLSARGLPTSVTTDGALELLDLAEQGQDRLQQAARSAMKHAELTSRVGRFGDEVGEIAARCGMNGDRVAEEPEVVIRQLHALLQRQSAVNAEAQSLLRQLQAWDGLAAQSQAELAVQEAQVAEWLAMAGAADALEFASALETSERRRWLSASLIRMNAELGAGLTDEQLVRIEEWYAVSDEASLHLQAERTRERLAELERGYRSRSEQIGRLRQELDTLIRQDDRRRLAEEKEQTAAVVEELSQQFLVRAAALAMIRRTKRMMEEKRQPGVLRDASRYMTRLSQGRYTRIVIPDGAQTVHLHTPDDRVVDSVHVSRGTAEQVYLAMRLALADEASASAGLPMLLDDLFVNFDRARLEAAVEIVKEIAGRRQLLLLTCHPHIRDLLIEAMPAAQLVELSS
ncbi:AAA domain-containing protein [Paenibacillus methanolicus]|uniref:AAA domain-containing protein n=2 Tax=Paenibacillus methanolicus TaxID=582686 RepID=A0A5S5C5Y8_9BACL|nr:AAA domain-containing protein [Paenibacillus methanolicus]